ncbi:hypothetical protein [Methyloglobulus sp.]|uniref:hypothetical protein n=1 Tax=Methyloglobulus sp. TaxID=2518622 RepID=UPI0032B83DB8
MACYQEIICPQCGGYNIAKSGLSACNVIVVGILIARPRPSCSTTVTGLTSLSLIDTTL